MKDLQTITCRELIEGINYFGKNVKHMLSTNPIFIERGIPVNLIYEMFRGNKTEKKIGLGKRHVSPFGYISIDNPNRPFADSYGVGLTLNRPTSVLHRIRDLYPVVQPTPVGVIKTPVYYDSRDFESLRASPYKPFDSNRLINIYRVTRLVDGFTQMPKMRVVDQYIWEDDLLGDMNEIAGYMHIKRKNICDNFQFVDLARGREPGKVVKNLKAHPESYYYRFFKERGLDFEELENILSSLPVDDVGRPIEPDTEVKLVFDTLEGHKQKYVRLKEDLPTVS